MLQPINVPHQVMKKPVVDTPYKGSWAEQQATKAYRLPYGPQHPTHWEQNKLMHLQGFKIQEAACNDRRTNNGSCTETLSGAV